MRLEPTKQNVEVFLFRIEQGTGYVRNTPLRLIDPHGLSPACYVDGFQTDCNQAMGMVSSGSAVQCPNNECMIYSDDQHQFQQFVAGAGGVAGYVNFSDLSQLNEWGGRFYTNLQLQKEVIQPRQDRQRRALATLIASIFGLDPDNVYADLEPEKTVGSNTDFKPNPELELAKKLKDYPGRRTPGAPSVHMHEDGLVQMDTGNPRTNFPVGFLTHAFVDVVVGNIDGNVPFVR